MHEVPHCFSRPLYTNNDATPTKANFHISSNLLFTDLRSPHALYLQLLTENSETKKIKLNYIEQCQFTLLAICVRALSIHWIRPDRFMAYMEGHVRGRIMLSLYIPLIPKSDMNLNRHKNSWPWTVLCMVGSG